MSLSQSSCIPAGIFEAVVQCIGLTPSFTVISIGGMATNEGVWSPFDLNAIPKS